MYHRLENGKPYAGFWWREQATGIGAISLSWTARSWARLVQMTWHASAAPTTSALITLWKDHSGTAYDVILKTYDPSVGALNLTDLVCLYQFYFEPGEIARLDYPNPDGRTIGVELYFERLDRKL